MNKGIRNSQNENALKNIEDEDINYNFKGAFPSNYMNYYELYELYDMLFIRP